MGATRCYACVRLKRENADLRAEAERLTRRFDEDRARLERENADLRAQVESLNAHAQAVLMSVTRTCWQRGQNVVTFLSHLLRRCRPEFLAFSP